MRNNQWRRSLAVFLVVCGLVLGLSSGALSMIGTFTTFQVPGAGGTFPQSINEDGAITGYYNDMGSTRHGFVRSKDGTITTFDPAGGRDTSPTSINEDGEITGSYLANGDHGFVRNREGDIITFDPPGSRNTSPQSINEHGTITGFYEDANLVIHGFVRNRHGKITTFDVRGARASFPQSINEDGEIAGYYNDANSVAHGFVRDRDGDIDTFKAPGAGTSPGQGTFGRSINERGAVVGSYLDPNNVSHGFVRHGGDEGGDRDRDGDGIATFDASGAGTSSNQGTVARSINEHGAITGFYVDANNVTHGFEREKHRTISTFDVLIAGGTSPQGINEDGAITGSYSEGNAPIGFVLSQTPSPIVGGGPPTRLPLPLPFSGVALDYDPEVRCADSNWAPFTAPIACSPQLSFTCPAPPPNNPFDNLSGCPVRCQSCFDQDLGFLKNTLKVNTITAYQPNYFVLTAARNLEIKVMMGTFNDTVLALATPDNGQASCKFSGFAARCGIGAVQSLINGACGATTPWDPQSFCTAGAYVPPFKSFLDDGTIVGIQLGNEILTSPVNGQLLTPAQVLAAAQALRTGLDQAGYSRMPIIVSFVAGTEKDLCANGAPPPNVDGIASHPYCNNVASVPPSWPFEAGATPEQAAQSCAQQVLDIFNRTAVASCGKAQSFIGETGYNTGCPGLADEANHRAVAQDFLPDMIALACQSQIPLFVFDYADACPATGCLPGCSGTPTPPSEGNGYFGMCFTENYLTKGNPVLKFPTVPTLSCPATTVQNTAGRDSNTPEPQEGPRK